MPLESDGETLDPNELTNQVERLVSDWLRMGEKHLLTRH
jgi:hypothetical protein